MATVIAPPRETSAGTIRIHVFLGAAVALMLGIGLIGCALSGVHSERPQVPIFELVLGGIFFLPVAYAHKHRHFRIRDTICFLFWAKIISQAIVPCVLFAARLRRPLEDAHLAAVDQFFGVSVGAIHAWDLRHSWLAATIDFTYPRLMVYLLIAIIVPIAFGQNRRVREYFVANVFGLLLMLPLFALVPAVGPWTVYHFQPSVWQTDCEKAFLMVRTAGPVWNSVFAGIVAFPSLHVFWAVVCAYTLYPMRWLRYPAMVFSVLIIASTMTMGWHYFSDVLAGLLLAIGCLYASRIVDARFFSRTPQIPAMLRGDSSF